MNTIRTAFILIVMVIAATPCLADSPQTAFSENMITFYYLEKDPARICPMLTHFQQSGDLEGKPGALPGLAAFFAEVFVQNPSMVADWARCAPFTGKAREMVEMALWLSGNAKLIQEVFKETPPFAANQPPQMLKANVTSPSGIDMLWGAFDATGNDAFVSRIVDVLDESRPLAGDPAMDSAIRKAAAWSLLQNMIMHDIVYRLVVREAGSRTGQTKAALDALLAEFKQKTAPHANQDGTRTNISGDFWVKVIVIDKKELGEFSTPSSVRLHFDPLMSARRGQTVAIGILFAGMELDKNQMCDLTYMLDVVSPTGKKSPFNDGKPLEYKKKLPSRFMVYNQDRTITFGFDSNDEPGVYKIVVTLHDAVSGKTVSSEQSLELVP